ncbi:hypothetical protein FisN_22Hh020 [Fistulifera solaris]|uniref:Chitin-binding type-2 domain-containing protein n=1 Tax=Fistulifera solaris TaxID=1519565 RepID=A0A1Z5K2G7_FISSO|nr:hypothetical protein FisN_22Hh020 [Fistulifera solaris]|eukprot:GAX20453.1 hypothetical protein FisN_22Hh020 [Fistulifera solaris]
MTNTSKSFAVIASLLLVSPYVDAGKVIRGRFFDRNKKDTTTKPVQNNTTTIEVPTAVRAPRAIPNFAMAEMTPEEIAEGIASRTWAAQCINSGDYGKADVGCDAGSKICGLNNQFIPMDGVGNSCARCINSFETIEQIDYGCDAIYRRCLNGENLDPAIWAGGTKCGLPCTFYSTIEGEVEDKIKWFNGGNPLPAGMYEIKYVGGCHKVTYDPGFSWCVHSNFESYRNWYIVDETYDRAFPGNVLAPGVVGHEWGKGEDSDYQACVDRNLAEAKPLLYQHKGGKLGVYNFDKDPYSQPTIMLYYDNVAGLIQNPTWSLKVVQCPDASDTPVDVPTTPEPEDSESKAPCCASGETGWRPYKGCKEYYYCMNGRALATQKCGAGTLFNGTVCDWANKVQCGKIQTRTC